MAPKTSELRLGFLSAIGAHILWGTFPLFWRQLRSVDSLEVVCHRVVWAFLFLLAAFPFLIRSLNPEIQSEVWKAFRSKRILGTYALAGGLVAINWLTFIWAVNHDRVLEASLGYYINPLLNVLLGVMVLGERLNKLQWSAVAVAAAGVLVMTVVGGGLPWVSLILACSFATYGLVKNRAPLPALIGLLLENSALLLPAVGYLAVLESSGTTALSSGQPVIVTFLVLGGIVTIAPLAMFAFAARRVPLSTIGLLQYIGPTIQFFIGTFLLSEPFDRWRFLGFACVWLALVLYLSSTRQSAPQATAGTASNR